MTEVLAGGPTAGSLLREAREAAGLHVAALAVSLKVPVRKLEALEQDRWDELTDAVFARALASSVCRTLKVDPQPVLERLPQSSAPRLVQDQDGIGAPFRAPGDAAAPGWLDQLTRPVFLAVFGLLLGALVLVFLPSLRRDDTATAKAEPSSAMVAPALVEPPPTAIEPMPSAQAVPTGAVAPPAAPVAAGAAAPARPAMAAAAPSVSPASAPAPAASVAAAASGIVVFRTQGPSWIEVTDAKGAVALRRLLAAGESAGASGALPLAVTVGSVSATAVEVRGKPYDLAPVSRDNVARFQVK